MKINANFRLFASSHFDATQYIPSPAYGVDRFMLDRMGNELARATTIVKYQPNSKFPHHTHIGGEEFIVLEGTFHDQYGTFPVGSYVRNPIGTAHEPWVEDDGCTIMVKLLQMTDLQHESIEHRSSLHIQLDTAKSEIGHTAPFGTVANLYINNNTGEVVEMCWVNPNTAFPSDIKSMGGEELFVISGSIQLKNDSNDINRSSTYDRWGWLRFPPKVDEQPWQQRQPLIAGASGAQFYRKTGHLTEKALSMEKIQIHEDEISAAN